VKAGCRAHKRRVKAGVVLLAALVLAAAAAAAAPEDKFYASQPNGPRVVLTRGEEGSPGLALYGDRRVIFRTADRSSAPSGYLVAQLADAQYRALVASVAPEALMKLGDSYVALTDADPPRHGLHLWGEGRHKAISVFGDLKNARTRSRVPPELLRALEAIGAFAEPGTPWLPSLFEVYLLPLAQSRGQPLPWPPGVPPYGYPSMKMKEGLNAMGMSTAHFGSVYRLLAELRPGQAVRLQDRNWAVAYSLALPYEEAWTKRSREQEIEVSHRVARPARAAAGEPSVVFEVLGGMGRDGPNSAVFALYGDGLVIVMARDGRSYRSTRLSGSRYQALIARIAPEGLLKLAGEYDAITATDPVANVIHVWVDGRRKTVSVAGHLDRSLPFSGRARTPPEFLRAYDAIADFSEPAGPWLPPQIEVILWPRERFPGQVLPWPQGWPSVESARVSRSGVHRVFVPAAEFRQVERLVAEDATRAVKAGNRLWSVAYRLPFPHEATWARR
jgi:hypothetical protein